MSTKIKIAVYQEKDEETYFKDKMTFIKTIERVPFNRGFWGNFIPHWCRYKGEEHLIKGSIDHSYMHGYDNDAWITLEEG